jgi:hypothetical protein
VQYDEKRLKGIRDKADEICRTIVIDDRKFSEDELRLAVDNMARTIYMFANMCLDLKDEIHDPLKYIEGKLGIAHQSITLDQDRLWDDPEE